MDIFYIFKSNLFIVIIGSALLSVTCSLIGTFNFLQKKSLLGDALSHSTLVGICLAFIITGNKDIFPLLIGGAISAFIWLYILKKIPLHSKIGEDPATAIVLSTSFSMGIMILSAIQKTQNASQAGLNNFLLGKIASLLQRDLYTIGGLSILIAFVFFIMLKELTIISFDRNFAGSMGLNIKFVDFIFTILTVFTIVVGVRIVGILLISAMLITPAAASRFWTCSLKKMLVISSFIGVCSGIIGVLISYKISNMPTGPCIVVVATIFAYLSFFFAPPRSRWGGYVFRYISQKKHTEKILNENILKTLYELNQEKKTSKLDFSKKMLLEFNLNEREVNSKLKSLSQKRYIKIEENEIFMTELGLAEGSRVAKVHLLWETYLTKYLKIKPDHVHNDAEGVEHVLTPGLVEELEKLLENSEKK